MAMILKAMKRPVSLYGVPMLPLLGTAGITIIVAIWTSQWLLLLLPVEFFILKAVTKNEPLQFHLIALWLKVHGSMILNRFFGAVTFMPNEYDAVDITEFTNAMKLNQKAAIKKYIPYSSHIHQNVVRAMSSDSFFCTWELLGTPFDCESEENLVTATNQLNGLFRSFEGMPVTFYIHNVRELFSDTLHRDSGNFYADEISRLYYNSLKAFYRNRLFVTLCYRPFSGMEKSERKRMKPQEKLSELEGALTEVLNLKSTLDMAFSRYGGRALGTFTEKKAVFSSQLAFYEYLLSHQWKKIRVTRTPVYEILGSSAFFFSAESGQVNQADGKSHYFRGLEIKEFSEESATGMMDALLFVPAEYIITQTYTCMSREEARKAIKRTKRYMMSADDDAISLQVNLDIALDLLMSGKISYGRHHFSLMVYADSMEKLTDNTTEISNTINSIGLLTAPSVLSLPAAYMAQLPGNYSLRPRLGELSSANFSELASLHNFYPGKRERAPWGDAISILKTPSGDAYYLNLHNTLADKDEFNEKNPASTCILGTNGSGKTMLMTFMEIMQQKYGLTETFSPDAKTRRITTVYLDKDRGAEINIRALGGRYFKVLSGEPTGWNPFALPPTRRNINFLKQLVKLLCTRNDQKITPRDEKRLSDAVDAVMSNDAKYRVYGITRILENLPEPATKEAQENGLSIRLAKWAQGGECGWVFDNEFDTFDIDCDNVGIDGTEFLDDTNVCAPISFYLLFRITSLLDGRRLVIYMDEFWKWLRDAVFKDFAYNKLKTIRKLNGMLVVGTQSPAEIVKDEIAPAVIEQCGTQILAANPAGDPEHYINGMKFEPEVFDMVKNLDPLARQYVVVKNQFRRGDTRRFAARITLDLSGIGKYTKAMSGSADNLEIFDSLYQEGMKPEEWLPAYLEKAL